jgi:hypothetical protein
VLNEVLSATVRARVTGLDHGAAYDAQVEALLAGTTDPYRAADALLSNP